MDIHETVSQAKQIAKEMMPERVNLWVFPKGDIGKWCKLTNQRCSYTDYMSQLAAVQAGLERDGHIVVRVRFSVLQMISSLRSLGLENTPKNRAVVIGKRAGQ